MAGEATTLYTAQTSTAEAAAKSCGHWCLSWQQLNNPLVDASGEGSSQAEEGGLPGLVGSNVLKLHTGTGRPEGLRLVGGVRGGHGEGLSVLVRLGAAEYDEDWQRWL